MNMQILDARRETTGGYKVDVSFGDRVGRVSSEWFSRPADERYLSLSELARSVRDCADRSRTRVVESALIHVQANRSDPERLALVLPGTDTAIAPTHWSFGQLAGLVGARAAYLRQLPAALAAINLQYGLSGPLKWPASHRSASRELWQVKGPLGRIGRRQRLATSVKSEHWPSIDDDRRRNIYLNISNSCVARERANGYSRKGKTHYSHSIVPGGLLVMS